MHLINIVLYSITIVCSVVQICVSLCILFLILLRRSHIHEQCTDFILYANTYIALFIIGMMLVDLSAYSIHGQLSMNPSSGGGWCRTKAGLLYVSGVTFFHSFALQAIYRLCRILYRTQARLYSCRLYVSLSGFLWILSFFELLPSLIIGQTEYLAEDHHCQFSPSNIVASATVVSIGFLFPFSLTVACYVWTLIRTRQQTIALTNINQHASFRRDLLVLKRLVVLLTVVTMVALPHAVFPVAHLITGELPSWSVSLEWAFTSTSLLLVSLVLPVISPHLKKLWKRLDDVHPIAAIALSARY